MVNPDQYVLPPPVGTANDMYEAFPQGPGTPSFSLPGATIGQQQSNSPWATTFDPGYNLAGQYTNATIGPQSKISAPSTQSWADWGKNLLGKSLIDATIPGQIANIAGGVKAATGINLDVTQYFNKAAIVLLGLVFIAGGLFLLAKEHGPAVRRSFHL